MKLLTKFNNEMATLSFVVIPSRPNSDGTFTIQLKITNVNTRALIPTKFKVAKIEQFQNGTVIKHPQAITINRDLRVLIGEYERLLANYPNPRATASEIKKYFEQPRFTGDLFKDYAERYIAALKDNRQDSYAKNMEYTLKHLNICWSASGTK